MSRLETPNSASLTVAVLALAALAFVPGIALADHHEGGDVASQVKAQIIKDNEYNREHLMDAEGTTSMHGAMEFWSSGGLVQWVEADAPVSKYESFAITPKHIKVIELPGGEAAVAVYYSEGSMQVEGGPLVSHYMTRVTQVFVKEDGAWKVRAAHWSPIAAGSGTTQSSLD
jgi:hypothetical protein